MPRSETTRRSPSAAGRPPVDHDDPGRLLAAWRSGRTLHPGDLATLRDLLGGSLTLHRRGWDRALAHDPALAVGVGVDLIDRDVLQGPAADVVMSTLLLHASAGNPAADLVVRHAVRRRRGLATVAGGAHEG